MARPRTTIATKPNDARAHRSIKALRTAFLKLIQHKPLEQITIKQITETAGVSHPTFHRRYNSKNDLLADIATEEVRQLLSLGQQAIEKSKSPESAKSMCEYVQSHRNLWKALLTGGAAPVMREEFMRISIDIAKLRPRANPWLPTELAVPLVANSIFEIFAWWMKQPEDYPMENVIKVFDALIIDSFVRPRNITLI